MEFNSNLSKTFEILRFPLALFVIYLHIMPNVDISSINYNNYRDLFSNYQFFNVLGSKIASCAVPTFFCISGYLLVYNIKKLNFSLYYKKLKNRFKTLFFPYLIWNLIAAAYLYFTKQITEFNLYFIFIRPANFPLWFLRNLIVMVLFFPFFYYIAKYIKEIGLIIISLIYILCPFLGITSLYYLPISVYFFYLGIFLGFKKFHIDNIHIIYKILIIIFTIGLLICEMSIRGKFDTFTNNIYLIFLVFSVFFIAHWFVTYLKWSGIGILASASFFIFCFHKIGPTYISKYIFNLLQIQNDVIIYLVSPIITVLICVGIYYLLDKNFKSLLKILTGR